MLPLRPWPSRAPSHVLLLGGCPAEWIGGLIIPEDLVNATHPVLSTVFSINGRRESTRRSHSGKQERRAGAEPTSVWEAELPAVCPDPGAQGHREAGHGKKGPRQFGALFSVTQEAQEQIYLLGSVTLRESERNTGHTRCCLSTSVHWSPKHGAHLSGGDDVWTERKTARSSRVALSLPRVPHPQSSCPS